MVQLSEDQAVSVENALEKGATALEATNPDLAGELTTARELLTKLLDAETGEKEEGGPAPPFG